MRQEDRERLIQPYKKPLDTPYQFEHALGSACDSVIALHQEIVADLDNKRWGIGWWAPHPGTKRRILISDYLVVSAWSIQANITEAKLHLLELADVWQQHSDHLADSVRLKPDGRLHVALTPGLRPSDDLPLHLGRLHAAGFFRSTIAALDCLGAAIIGVIGLPISILRSDFETVRRALPKNPEPVPGLQLQYELAKYLEEVVQALGGHLKTGQSWTG